MTTATIARLSLTIFLVTGSVARCGDTALADAAERADWARVARLIKNNVHSVNAVQADGMTALHWAAWHDRLDMVEKLLDRQADPSAANRYGVTPLALACENGHGELVTRLLTAGADAKSRRPGGETALMTAARSGSLVAVQSLLKHKADVNSRDRQEQTAVMWAAAEGHARVVSELIAAGADFQKPLKSGFAPLFFAAREGQLEVIAVLLRAGCDVDSEMRPSIDGGRIVRSGTTALMLAVENGHFELAVELLKAGADANHQRSGFTPLHAITWVRKPNRGDSVDGDPPPIGSGKLTSLQLVRKLVAYGADVNRKLKRGRSGRGKLNHRGATPFLFAADTADVPLMKLLLELGADPTVSNADNCPPLLAAAGIGTKAPGEEAGTEEEALAAVKYLLTLGADINAVDKNRETCMHGAAYASWPEMARFLAAHGADIQLWNQKNKYGWTPLLIAEGHRPGNFKPAAATIKAVRDVMLQSGVTPPEPTPPKRTNDEYSRKKQAAAPALQPGFAGMP